MGSSYDLRYAGSVQGFFDFMNMCNMNNKRIKKHY